MNSKASAVIIGGCVVSKFMDNGIRIRPLKWLDQPKMETMEQFTTESKAESNRVLQKLSDGKLTYDELIKTYF